MKKSIFVLMSVITLSGCYAEHPQVVSAQEFAIHYDKITNECKRIVIGEDTTYSCKNPADTTVIYTHHSRKSSLGGSGQNSGAYAIWDNNKKLYAWDAPFQIY